MGEPASVIAPNPAPAAGGDPAAPGGQPAANAPTWHDSFDADTKQWIGGMGLDKLPADQALAKVLPMYRGAESKLGVPADKLLRLPKDENDAEGFMQIMSKLGRPEKPEDYGLQAPEGDSGEFVKTASGWFHELGIPKRQAAGLAAKWNEHVQATQNAETERWNARHDEEMTALKGEWQGEAFDKNMDLAKRVMGAFGYTPEQLQAIERAVGPKAMLQGFQKFGAALGEHRFVGDGNANFGGGSIDEQIAALRKDPEYGKDSVRGREINQKIYELTQQDTRLANTDLGAA